MDKVVSCVLIVTVLSVNGRMKYDLSMYRLEVDFVNRSLMDFGGFINFYNRTAKGVNMNATFHAPITEKTMVHFTMYVFQSGVYRLSAIQLKDKMATFLKLKTFSVQRLFTSFDPVMQWPLQSGVPYVMTNYICDPSNYPPLLPAGKFKFLYEMYLTGNELKMLAMMLYGELKHDYV